MELGGNYQSNGRLKSANVGRNMSTGYLGAKRKPNIRLGSGQGPSSNIFKVKNGKLMLSNPSTMNL
jgi:hypothetical protein